MVTILTAVMDRLKEMGPELEEVKLSCAVLKKERDENRENDGEDARAAKKTRFFGGKNSNSVSRT